VTLRLLVNLTNPELLLFKEELPEDKETRNYYLQIQVEFQTYFILSGKLCGFQCRGSGMFIHPGYRIPDPKQQQKRETRNY